MKLNKAENLQIGTSVYPAWVEAVYAAKLLLGVENSNLPFLDEDGNFVDYKLALGEHENNAFSEITEGDVVSMVILNKKRNSFKVFRMNTATKYSDSKTFGEKRADLIAILAVVMRELEVNDPSFSAILQGFKNSLTTLDSMNADTVRAFLILAADIAAALKPFVSTENCEYSQLFKRAALPEIDITQVEMGKLGPTKVICGVFQGFKSSAKIKHETIKMSDIADKFKIDPKRVFSAEEKALMYQVPSWYSPSENVISIAEKIKASWDGDKNLRKINVLMEGPAGTGKTQDSKVLSTLLGIPYTKITCFSDMDSSDVAGSIYPVADEDASNQFTDDDIFFDPAGCYEKLIGQALTEREKAEITEEDVHELLLQKAADKNNPRYVYYASEIVKAFENGWLVEIQEPTCVADAAVLLILNSALEKDGIINLAQRTVKRHPDCIIVMTTNRNYEGCRPLNQSLRDRFNITKKVELPPVDELADRLESSTGCKDRGFLVQVIESITDLNKYLENNGINATVSLRGMQDFVADVMRGFEPRESALEDMIYKITTDDDDLSEIISFLEISTPLFSLKLN